ncbi:MAG: hypothetical protein V1873_06010 [Verrucomicrobiota bacterium]
MRTRWIAVFLLAAMPTAAVPDVGADVPVAPVPAINYLGWTNAYVLQTPALEVVVVPCIGRIAQIRYRGGENLLRLDPGLAGRVPDGKESWLNFGGDWLWPVAQSRWKDIWGSDWPPPAALADRPWDGTAWKDADGASCCLMSREYGAPVNLRVSRLIKLDREAPFFTIRQRIERTAASDVPVVLWNITQIAGAARLVLPRDPESALERGIRALLFGLPGNTQLTECARATVYDARTGEHKLCSDSHRAWIAAQKGDTLVVEHAAEENVKGSHPDGGCTVEMYSNAGLGYSEIETLSVESNILPGESLQNTISIHFATATNVLTDCELADVVGALLGEETGKPPAAPPAE